jgi:DNA polymerase III subunit beta
MAKEAKKLEPAIRLSQEGLKETMAAMHGCIERKSTIPVLQNVLIESVNEGRSLRFTATDLDVTIEREVEAQITDDFVSVCVSAGKLFDIVKNLPRGEVTITKQDNDWITLSCARSNYKIAGVSRDKYPDRKVTPKLPVTLNADQFRNTVERTMFAITNEQSRFTLSGAKVELADGKLRMVTTDGHRLSFVEVDCISNEKLDLMMPRKALSEIAKMGQSGGLQIGIDSVGNHVFCNAGGQLLNARTLSGSFPNYQMVMPADNDKKAIVGALDLKAAIRRASMMADDRHRKIAVTLSDGEMTLSAESSEEGESKETMPCEYKGDTTTLLFQWVYIYEFLNVATKVKPEMRPETEENAEPVDTRVYLTFKDQNAQIEFGVEGDETWRYVVMPLRG